MYISENLLALLPWSKNSRRKHVKIENLYLTYSNSYQVFTTFLPCPCFYHISTRKQNLLQTFYNVSQSFYPNYCRAFVVASSFNYERNYLYWYFGIPCKFSEIFICFSFHTHTHTHVFHFILIIDISRCFMKSDEVVLHKIPGILCSTRYYTKYQYKLLLRTSL